MNNVITQLQLINFTKFGDLVIDFSPKINVIIGENSTGKTHLLKAAYAVIAGRGHVKDETEINTDDLSSAITTKLLKVFMPLDGKLGNLRKQGAGNAGNAQLRARFATDSQIHATFHTNSKSIVFQDRSAYNRPLPLPVFIPTKEVLSIMAGFASLYQKFALSFDQTYADIVNSLDLPEARPEQVVERTQWAMKQIKETIGGRFLFHGGGRVTFKTVDAEFSANAMAEGFRKAGILLRLLETTALQPGVSGPLFWDEPEANMNPKLMRLLVDILLEFSRMGQQIIIATHDYVFLKWLDLLPQAGDHVRFHTLYQDESTGEIAVNSVDSFDHIKRSAISDTFAELYDADVERALR